MSSLASLRKVGGFICVTPRWIGFAYRIFQFNEHLSIVMLLVMICVTEGCVVLFICNCRCLSIRNSRKWALTLSVVALQVVD